jgi:hypothetical protein
VCAYADRVRSLPDGLNKRRHFKEYQDYGLQEEMELEPRNVLHQVNYRTTNLPARRGIDMPG